MADEQVKSVSGASEAPSASGGTAPTPIPKEVVGSTPAPQKSSNSPIVVTITVMVIVALGVAGFFFVKNNGQTETTATTSTQPTLTSVVASPTIDPTDETQIEAIDIGDADTSDLTSVEKDINSL